MSNYNKCTTCSHNYSPKEISFEDLLNQYDKILIPKIQRDYAQGRLDAKAKDVRENLLNDIFSKENVKFDFIFGTQQKRTEANQTYNCFIPLDGQQRLTTLFLLYLYRIKNKKIKNEKTNNIDLHKFTYDTRRAAKDFCLKITSVDNLDFDGVSLSENIKNSTWFLDYWQYDPTVESMLNMLDSIHTKVILENKLSELENIKFPELENIKFHFFDMDEHKLNENLYLKMNSRGKPLTAFENLKAALDKMLPSDEINPKNHHPFLELEKKDEHLKKKCNKFSEKWKHCIDRQWTDFFWKYKENFQIDASFLRLLSNCLTGFWIANAKFDESKKTLILEYEGKEATQIQIEENRILSDLRKITGNESFISFDIFKPIFDFKESFYFVASALNRLHFHKEEIIKNSTPSWEVKKEKKEDRYDILKILATPNDSQLYKERTILFAILVYKGDEFNDSFKQWIRVVWNIVENSNVDSPRTFISAIKFIKELSDYSDKILESLQNESIMEIIKSKTQFAETQIDEEAKKARLFLDKENGYNWKKEITQAEADILLKGYIDFLLLENIDLEKFKKYRDEFFKLTVKYFGNETFLLTRATLSKCEPDNIYNSFPIIFNESNDNWKNLLKKEFKNAIIKLIDCCIKNENHKDVLFQICSEYVKPKENKWMYHLISWIDDNQKPLLVYSETKRVQKYQDEIYLYNKTNWTDSNILLTSFRNEIISELLKNSELSLEWEHGNIHNSFFRGANVKLNRKVLLSNNEVYDCIYLTYSFEKNCVHIGLDDSDNSKKIFTSLLALPEKDFDETTKGWIYRKTFNFQDEVKSEEDVQKFLQKIECNFFESDDNFAKKLSSLIKKTNS